MFKGYQEGLDKLKPNRYDIIIMCHDDIEILTDREEFTNLLENALYPVKIGFVGPAGTSYLGADAVWWDMTRRQQGFHSGFVFQGLDRQTMQPNYFGPTKDVVVLDGLFLACRKSTLDLIDMSQPATFPWGWDFYDLYYTMTAYTKGFTNRTVPIIMLHNSSGETRPTWNENRMAFQKMFNLPVRC
tara:strand:+ start:8751 stop:9308 length:558 start_codon:yes stop_codon:yes gene_type:complete